MTWVTISLIIILVLVVYFLFFRKMVSNKLAGSMIKANTSLRQIHINNIKKIIKDQNIRKEELYE